MNRRNFIKMILCAPPALVLANVPTKVVVRRRKSQLKTLESFPPSFPRPRWCPLPTGQYTARIDCSWIQKTQGGRLCVVWELTVIQGSYTGRRVRKYGLLDTQLGIDFFAGDLETLGVGWPESIEKLSNALKECDNAIVRIAIVWKDEFCRVYYRR